MQTEALAPKVVVVIVDGLPADLLERTLPDLPFLRSRLPYGGRAVSCFPSTTGPAYYPLVAGCTPKAPRDTHARTLFARHAWPCSSPIAKDSPKRCREASRDLVWSLAHFFHTWDQCDRRTAWALGRALGRGREILLSADHGLTETHTHLDLRALVEERVGATLAFPLVGMPNPAAVVCESGNAMANVYLRGEGGWRERPSLARARQVATELLELDGIDSVAIRGPEPHTAELWTTGGVGEVGFSRYGLFQRGEAFRSAFAGATPREALARSLGEEHPDAAFALTSLFASERAGDLLVSARVGYDLRDRREWPEHHA